MKTARGMSLIDVIVGAFLVLVIFMGLFALVRVAIQVTSAAKAKAGAVAVLSSTMEHVRGLSYADVGTLEGVPLGILPETATTTTAGFTYVVRISVQYVDGAGDGVGDADVDGDTEEYKRVLVEVVYDVSGKERTLPLVFAVTPRRAEVVEGGAVHVRVLDAAGSPVSGAEVTIENALLSPEMSVTALSDASGMVFFSGLATSSMYEIAVMKDGYSRVMTYGRSVGNAHPLLGHATVAEGEITSMTVVIDSLAALTLRTFSKGETELVPLPNVSYTLVGSKTIGSTALGEPVYKTELSRTTGAFAVRTDELEYDTYTLSVSGYDVVDVCEVPPFSLTPGSSLDAGLTLGPSTARSVLVAVRDYTRAPVPSASVTVSRPGYSETEFSSECGSAYFGSLPAGVYAITIAADGYETITYENVSVTQQTFYVASFE